MSREGGLADGKTFSHQPVMLAEVIENLKPSSGMAVVDATLGGGGHAQAILERVSPQGMLIGIDRDEDAIRAARERLAFAGQAAIIVHARMSEISDVLARMGVPAVDGILADLGVSSFQFDEADRGFSIRNDGPLDMRMEQGCGVSARDLIKHNDAIEIERIIREYGEERYARRIANAIAGRDIATTGELVRIIECAVPAKARWQRIHPATRTFQALRIAVNDELQELRMLLASAPSLLKPGGMLVVISYHSLEDRLVKRSFRERASGGEYSLPKRKALRPTEVEISMNARARSAKLRSLKRVKQDAAAQGI
jgi:16S rRNA (cytosine1402-N4)-methyltransferase